MTLYKMSRNSVIYNTPKIRERYASDEVWFSRDPRQLPEVKVAALDKQIFAASTGPDEGLVAIGKKHKDADGAVAGHEGWNQKSEKAYGICLTLYDQHPVKGTISGDPIADAFAVMGRSNSGTLVVADGVNWGEASKTAARAAVFAAMRTLNRDMYCGDQAERGSIGGQAGPQSTLEVFRVLLRGFDEAHAAILAETTGLTTLCAATVTPIAGSHLYVACCVNVGDSLAFVWSKRHGMRELSVGSHDVRSERNIRDAGGALGPVNGKQPELHNLTCSLTLVEAGDLVFLATDGVTDNCDPVICKLVAPAAPVAEDQDSTPTAEPCSQPALSPAERHRFALKQMEAVLCQFELDSEAGISAQQLCGALVQHIVTLTDPKRKVLEDPTLYVRRKLKAEQRKARDDEIYRKMNSCPGKLDHATVVAYEAGRYAGEGQDPSDVQDLSITSPTSPLKPLPSSPPRASLPTSPSSPVSSVSAPSAVVEQRGGVVFESTV